MQKCVRVHLGFSSFCSIFGPTVLVGDLKFRDMENRTPVWLEHRTFKVRRKLETKGLQSPLSGCRLLFGLNFYESRLGWYTVSRSTEILIGQETQENFQSKKTMVER